jgi:hypothetical protein
MNWLKTFLLKLNTNTCCINGNFYLIAFGATQCVIMPLEEHSRSHGSGQSEIS